MKNFIKVVNPEIAEQLVLQGFQYIKEQNTFAFQYSDELIDVLQQQYAKSQFACETKLRF